MAKKIFCLLAVLTVLSFTSLTSKVLAESVVLKEVEVQDAGDSVKIFFPVTKSIPIECYDLMTPPQIVIDFMGEIYSSQSEVILVNKGAVKQLRVVKGTKQAPDLADNYYPVDFIIVDLNEAMRYDFEQGLTSAVLVITKVGAPAASSAPAQKTQAVETPKAAVVEQKVEVKQPVSTAAAVPAVAQTKVKEEPVKLENKEYEEPVKAKKEAGVSAVPADSASVVAAVPATSAQVTTGAPKVEKKKGKGLRYLFKSKKTDKKEEKAAKPAEVKEKKEKKGKQEKKIAQKEEEKPKGKFKSRKKKKAIEASVSGKEPAGVLPSEPQKKLEALKQKRVEKADQSLKIYQEINAANSELARIESQKDDVFKSVSVAQQAEVDAKLEFDASVKQLNAVKNSANVAWQNYSSAKENLSALLTKGATADEIKNAQQIYEQKKVALEKALADAEQAKIKNNQKLALYDKAKEETVKVTVSTGDPQIAIDLARAKCEEAKKRYNNSLIELNAIDEEITIAENACKQYELQQSEEQYKQSLSKIDVTIVKEPVVEKPVIEKPIVETPAAKSMDDEKVREEVRKLALEKAEQKRLEEEKKAAKEKKKKKKEPRKKKIKTKRRKISEPELPVAAPVVAPAVTEKAAVQKAEEKKSVAELRNAGLEMQKAGDLDKAMKYYQEAAMADPNYATVHNDMGILYEQRGQNEKAKIEYLNALKIDPRYVRAHSNLALLYEKLGDYNKSYYHWKQRAELGNPDDPWTKNAKEKVKQYEQQKK